MAIDMITSNAAKSMPETIASKTAGKKTINTASTTKAPDSNDAIALSADAKVFSSAVATAKASDGIDHQKVEALRKQIQEGTYQIDYQKLANNMVESDKQIRSIF